MTTVLLVPAAVESHDHEGHYRGIVIEVRPAGSDPTRITWTSPVLRTSTALAQHDAEEAVDHIAYQRRHQLDLWQDHGIGEDPYLAGAEVRS